MSTTSSNSKSKNFHESTAPFNFLWDPGKVLRLPDVLGGELVKVREHFYDKNRQPLYKMAKGSGYTFAVPAEYAEKTFIEEPTRVR